MLLFEQALRVSIHLARLCKTIATLEPATLAKYAFTLAQRFNLFYHRHRIIAEPDPARRNFYLSIVELTQQAFVKTLDMMGIQAPWRM